MDISLKLIFLLMCTHSWKIDSFYWMETYGQPGTAIPSLKILLYFLEEPFSNKYCINPSWENDAAPSAYA